MQEKVEIELRKIKEDATFRATPVKTPVASVEISERIKSEKVATKAVGMRLISDKRSVKREEFESAMREKERLKVEE